MNTMKYATRLNSFVAVTKDVTASLKEIASAGSIQYVDLNYPEHFVGTTPSALKDQLDELGLTVNSVAMRFRAEYMNGEYSNRDPQVRQKAIELTKQGLDAAKELGSDLVTVWLGFDGFDYTFQKDYVTGFNDVVSAFQEIADYDRDMRISIEYKPYEERVYSLIPNVGMTLYALSQIDRDNVGATLDFAHMLMAGDSPGYGAHMLLAQGKLWGVHLNDGNSRHDDGLMIGSVHLWETVEFLYLLLRYNYDGVIYFDTFPIREEPRAEAEVNAQTVDHLVEKLRSFGVDKITATIDQADGIASQTLRNALT